MKFSALNELLIEKIDPLYAHVRLFSDQEKKASILQLTNTLNELSTKLFDKGDSDASQVSDSVQQLLDEISEEILCVPEVDLSQDAINSIIDEIKSIDLNESRFTFGSALLEEDEEDDFSPSFPIDSSEVPHGIPGSIEFASLHDLDFEAKANMVQRHLQRLAAAEEFLDNPAKKVGYAAHLEWFNKNYETVRTKGEANAKKDKLVVDAYFDMPGFGVTRDGKQYIRLHQEIDVLKLEIKGLEKRKGSESDVDNELIEKQETLQLFENKLAEELKRECKEIQERLAQAIRDNPEDEEYFRPLAEKYITWLSKVDKSGTKPTFSILDGPPGTGKTRFGEQMANILGIPFEKVVMSSVDDKTMVPGRGKGWEDPKPGKYVELATKCKSAAFLWMPDELEKADRDVINTHVDLFESGQGTYDDEFFNGLKIPAIHTQIIGTTNVCANLPDHIRSRASIILMKGKTPEQKARIVKKMLQKKLLESVYTKEKKFGEDIKFEDDSLVLWLLQTYSTEPGLREEIKMVDIIVAAVDKQIRENEVYYKSSAFIITKGFIKGLLKEAPKIFQKKRELENFLNEERTQLQGFLQTWDAKIARYGDRERASLNIVSKLDDDFRQLLTEIVHSRLAVISACQDLIRTLNEQKETSPDMASILEPRIKELEQEVKQQVLQPHEIKFLSEHCQELEELDTDVLQRLIQTRLDGLCGKIDEETKGISRSRRDDDAKRKHTEQRDKYLEESTQLRTLQHRLNGIHGPAISSDPEVTGTSGIPRSPSVPSLPSSSGVRLAHGASGVRLSNLGQGIAFDNIHVERLKQAKFKVTKDYSSGTLEGEWDVFTRRFENHLSNRAGAKTFLSQHLKTSSTAGRISREQVDWDSIHGNEYSKDNVSKKKTKHGKQMLFTGKTDDEVKREMYRGDLRKHLIRQDLTIENNSGNLVISNEGQVKAESVGKFDFQFKGSVPDPDALEQVIEHMAEKASSLPMASIEVYGCSGNIQAALDIARDVIASIQVIDGKPSFGLSFANDGTKQMMDDILSATDLDAKLSSMGIPHSKLDEYKNIVEEAKKLVSSPNLHNRNNLP